MIAKHTAVIASGFLTAFAGAGSLSLAQSTNPCASRPPSVAASDPVRVPIQLANNHVLLTVCHAGRPLVFLLDTGAGANVLDLGTARRLGVELGAPMQAGGAGAGAAAGAMLDTGSVSIPGLPGEIPLAIALDLRRLQMSKGRQIDGILGYDFIERFVFAIDYRARELRLYDRTSFRYSGAGMEIPLIMENNHPHVRASVTLKDGGTIAGKFVIDVGSWQSVIITKPIVDQNRLRERVGPTMQFGGGGGLGGTVTSEIGRIARLDVGPVQLSNVVVAMFGDSAGVFSNNRLWDGNIGSDVLRRFTVYFDYRAPRMILEPHAGTSEPFEADMSGMRVATDSAFAELRVAAVNPGSPADEVGVRSGDAIVRIDGRDVTGAAVDPLRERLRRAGEQVTLTIRRGSATMEIRVVTRRIV